jgi:proteic killer suppression protein
MRSLPGRCHELRGGRAGTFAVSLDGPYRLILEPAHNPLPIKDDGGIDWSGIKRIRILEIEDYHG